VRACRYPTARELVFFVRGADEWTSARPLNTRMVCSGVGSSANSNKRFLFPKTALRSDCDFVIRVSKAGHGNNRVWKAWKTKKPAAPSSRLWPTRIADLRILGFPWRTANPGKRFKRRMRWRGQAVVNLKRG